MTWMIPGDGPLGRQKTWINEMRRDRNEDVTMLPLTQQVRCNPYVAPRRNQRWPKYIIVHSTYIIYYITYKSEGVLIFDPLGR